MSSLNNPRYHISPPHSNSNKIFKEEKGLWYTKVGTPNPNLEMSGKAPRYWHTH